MLEELGLAEFWRTEELGTETSWKKTVQKAVMVREVASWREELERGVKTRKVQRNEEELGAREVLGL